MESFFLTFILPRSILSRKLNHIPGWSSSEESLTIPRSPIRIWVGCGQNEGTSRNTLSNFVTVNYDRARSLPKPRLLSRGTMKARWVPIICATFFFSSSNCTIASHSLLVRHRFQWGSYNWGSAANSLRSARCTCSFASGVLSAHVGKFVQHQVYALRRLVRGWDSKKCALDRSMPIDDFIESASSMIIATGDETTTLVRSLANRSKRRRAESEKSAERFMRNGKLRRISAAR